MHLTFNSNYALLTFENNGKPPVINLEFLHSFKKILAEIKEQKELKGLILKGTTANGFIAGADLKEISQVETKEAALQVCELAQITFHQLANFGVPTIAIIEGACLGGGLELALACNYRIAIESEKTTLGLPEVSLGILPGFGGTVRVGRLLEFEKAIEVICSGKRYSAKKALKIGLIDKVVATEQTALSIAEILLVNGLLPKRTTKSQIKNTLPARFLMYQFAKRNIQQKTQGHYPAPLKALETLYQGLRVDEIKAYQIEREAVAELLIGPIAKNLINLFFTQEKYKKTYSTRTPELKEANLKIPTWVGIVGAGLMGGGIAQLLMYKGLKVLLSDIKQEQLDLALKTVNKLTIPLVKQGKLSEGTAAQLLAQVLPQLDLTNFEKNDFVIEAVVENIEVKKKVIQALDQKVTANCIIATNTSSLSVNEIAMASKHPERVIGLHFFSPVHKMPLVEIIPSDYTTPEVIEQTFRFALKLGKIPVFCKDRTCFIVNRILGAYLNEASWCLLDGYTAHEIDQAMRQYGLPMGPCELMDEVGIFVSNEVAKKLQTTWPERFNVPTLLEKMLDQKLLGKRVSKEGFYSYSRNLLGMSKKALSRKTQQIIKSLQYKPERKLTLEDRLIGAMKQEALQMVNDQSVNTIEDINLALILGIGFPPFRGGLV